MGDIVEFGRMIVVVSGGRRRDPRAGGRRPARPADRHGLLLVVAAAASDLVDRLSTILQCFEDVQRIATLALVVILFEGGSNIGHCDASEQSAAPIIVLGLVGTFGTAALLALGGHLLLASPGPSRG